MAAARSTVQGLHRSIAAPYHAKLLQAADVEFIPFYDFRQGMTVDCERKFRHIA